MLSSSRSERNLVTTTASQFFAQAARRVVVAGVGGMLALSLVACAGASSATSTTAGYSDESSAQGAVSQDTADKDAKTDGSSASSSAEKTVDAAVLEAAESFSIDTSKLFSDRDLDASYDESAAVKVTLADGGKSTADKGVTVDGSTVTITSAGTYVLSGTLKDGRIVVDAGESDKVQLVLDGVDVTSSTGTALYVREADKVFVTLAKGATNKLASTGDATEEDDHTLDGTVFSSSDLTVNGKGTLEVTSSKAHGVVAKDELTLVSGTLKVTAASHAVQAKDSLAAKGGTYTLDAGKDGIHVEHDSNGEKGFAYVAGGTFNITAKSDGIDASNDLQIDDGKLTIAADDDALHSEYDLVVNGGTIKVSQSYEGLEGARVTVNGGDIDVVSSDDGVNATGNPDGTTSGDAQSNAGGFAGKPGKDFANKDADSQGTDAQDSDAQGAADAGKSESSADKNADAQSTADADKTTDAQSTDAQGADGKGPQADGMGPQGASDGDGAGAMHMGGGFENDDTASIAVSGGKLVVNADGDGIDSNGSFLVSGGEVYVSGPTSNGNGAIDAAGDVSITGGTVVAAGSTGMAMTFGTNSTQGSMLVQLSGEANDKVELKDAQGKVLASFTPAKSFGCVVLSAPGVEKGGTYTVTCGSNSVEVTLDSISYGATSGGMGAMGGHGANGDGTGDAESGGPGMGGGHGGHGGPGMGQRQQGGSGSQDQNQTQKQEQTQTNGDTASA